MPLSSSLPRQVTECWPAAPGRYRYRLVVKIGAGPALTVILKNPSRADATRRDPTVGKVEAWARRHGFGQVTYVNLFAWRAPHPAALNALSVADAIGPEDDAVLAATLAESTCLAAGWGNPNGIDVARYAQRIAAVRALIVAHASCAVHVVGGWTKAGHPRHGLHWNGDAVMLPWRASGIIQTADIQLFVPAI